MSSIFRIVTQRELIEAKESGQVPRNVADETSGYVHLSPKSEVLTTAQRYYSNHQELSVLEVNSIDLGAALRWERVESRNNVSFPHLYAPNIPWTAVKEIHTLTQKTDGCFEWQLLDG